LPPTLKEPDGELLHMAAAFNEEVATKEKAAKEIEEKLATLSKNKEKHEHLLLQLKGQAGSLKNKVEVRGTGMSAHGSVLGN
jgi:hypothetical protein